MPREAREELFDTLSTKYEKVVARQVSESIEVKALADENGNAVWHIKQIPAWALTAFQQFDPMTEQVMYACGMIAVSAHDMFGAPVFYDNEDQNGNPYTINERMAQIATSRDKLASYLEISDITEIFMDIQEARKKIAEQMPSGEEVKERSSQETTT